MKTNHEQVIQAILQALRHCREDAALADVRKRLNEALLLARGVGDRRSARDSRARQYAEEAKGNHERWIQMLTRGIRLDDMNDEQKAD